MVILLTDKQIARASDYTDRLVPLAHHHSVPESLQGVITYHVSQCPVDLATYLHLLSLPYGQWPTHYPLNCPPFSTSKVALLGMGRNNHPLFSS